MISDTKYTFLYKAKQQKKLYENFIDIFELSKDIVDKHNNKSINVSLDKNLKTLIPCYITNGSYVYLSKANSSKTSFNIKIIHEGKLIEVYNKEQNFVGYIPIKSADAEIFIGDNNKVISDISVESIVREIDYLRERINELDEIINDYQSYIGISEDLTTILNVYNERKQKKFNEENKLTNNS